ncbi:MAG: arginine--tRNA ligase [Planctomycetes bacterium RBG_13_62_9]|nr:MAG: arginine--tRNA ligase [Planctomycetes bacterium RBG_13_62_9]
MDILEEGISAAMAEVTGRPDCAAIVRPATDPRFGDYQANGVMALAKQIETNPRKLAEAVVEKVDVSDLCEPPEIAGPGFINLRLKSDYIAEQLLRIHSDTQGRLGMAPTPQPQTVVVDFSSPNIAKEMHVGHLRSTIIGDAICRLLEFLGHNVIRQNHIGDWGTQFGRVILALWHICMAENLHKGDKPYYIIEDLEKDLRDKPKATFEYFDRIRNRHQQDWLADSREVTGDGELYFHPFLATFSQRSETLWPALLEAYRYVNLLEGLLKDMKRTIQTRVKTENGQFVCTDIPYESLSRHITAMLQQGGQANEQERKAWEAVKRLTLDECNTTYERLGVQLTDEDVRGESFYNDKLPAVVSDLKKAGLAVQSEGAICVFPPGFKTKEGEPLPFIVQKSDGAYLYATTDLAALRYRVNELKADKIIYVTDARQIQHFQMLFKVAEMAGWDHRDGRKVELVHVTFGSVLGEDGRPLKARSGENVKLKELLDEAVERARGVVEEKNPELPEHEKTRIAEAVGIGAVKYADYSNNRTSDYVFSFEKMLAMDGNTAPYMQYAYARVRSIERKAETRNVDIRRELADIANLDLGEPTELYMGKHLARYAEALEAAASDYRPNYVTAYLYELSQKFSAFYTDCPVLDAPPDKRPTRLLLCDLTADTIRHGLSQLLGIAVVEQM